MTRLRAKYGAAEARAILSREAAETEKAADANSTPLGRENDDQKKRAASFLPALPAAGAAEWWDAALLSDGKSYGAEVLREKITLYVEHPVPLPPPAGAEAPPPPPQPLKLTKAEQKKLRTQRRVAREQEKQEMIRQGLLEPPKPKVKISNLMRVLTDTAAADPTAIEKEVRAQMAERAEAHEDRNLARALTPAERKEKKLRKMFEDSGGSGETHVRVYRIESLKNPKHKFRVDINAQENHLTGTSRACAFFFRGVSLSVSRRREKKNSPLVLLVFGFPPGRAPSRNPADPKRFFSRPLKTPRSLCTESLRALSGDRAKSQHEAGTESRLFARNFLTKTRFFFFFSARLLSLTPCRRVIFFSVFRQACAW
jgi:U4/U6 small nuclear ribonucleoprotein PRP3